MEQDEAKAAFWYRKAAEQNDARAQYLLGSVYAEGSGVEQDDTQAVFWYRKAAEQGLAGAQFNLAVSYAGGKGIARDLSQSLRWFRQAAEQGDAGAYMSLGYMYENGVAVRKDRVAACALYALAIQTSPGIEQNAPQSQHMCKSKLTAQEIASAGVLVQELHQSGRFLKALDAFTADSAN